MIERTQDHWLTMETELYGDYIRNTRIYNWIRPAIQSPRKLYGFHLYAVQTGDADNWNKIFRNTELVLNLN